MCCCRGITQGHLGVFDDLVKFCKPRNASTRFVYILFIQVLSDTVVICCSTEPHIFKLQFEGWDDVIAVDYTRTSESVQRRGVDMKACIIPKHHNRLTCIVYFFGAGIYDVAVYITLLQSGFHDSLWTFGQFFHA